MSDAGSCRLAILASHPIQYFTPVYRRLASVPGLEVEVWYCRDFGARPRYDQQFDRVVKWDVDQLDGYSHRFLFNASPISNTFNPLHAINPGAFWRMFGRFDALWVNGYLYPSNYLAAIAAKASRARVLMRSELRADMRRDSKVPQSLRDAIIRRWIAMSDALLYIGCRNREAYLAYGADDSKLFFTPYSVDVDELAAAGARRADCGTLRRQWGVPEDRIVLLFVGKLTPRKHPEAMLHLAAECGRNVQIVLVGSGPLEQQLHAEVARIGLTNVSFLGFVNQRRLPEVYALADVFVMPSENEPWGLVLNEAMAAGLPPVVCADVGASADLIREGETGFTFANGDWSAMTALVRQLVTNPKARAIVGAAARTVSHRYSYRATASGVVDALTSLGVYATPSAVTAMRPAHDRA
ncbi:MAG TPA: glycosyltransferase family 4 protein [Gemmatimonadaceae bacterium]|nr:glycosyltransferase family 4 protein [Gemmatimonadaceae bacterium]